jgi:hypothetical protein
MDKYCLVPSTAPGSDAGAAAAPPTRGKTAAACSPQQQPSQPAIAERKYPSIDTET